MHSAQGWKNSGGGECMILENAKWIKSPENEPERCYEFYRNLKIKKKVQKAIFFASAMGMYKGFLNGQPIGNELFAPYWTAYTATSKSQTIFSKAV